MFHVELAPLGGILGHLKSDLGVFWPFRATDFRYSWRDPLGRFGMTQFVDVGPETTIWTFDPLC
jgi:hypothetical protein